MRALALALAAACGDGSVNLEPILEAPPPGSGAHPWDRIDEVRLSVGRVGEDPLVEAAFPVGAPLVLAEVPFGRDLVVHVSGRRGGVEAAYGRTCAVDVTPEGASERRPRLWFSRIVRWALGPDPTPRVGGHAYALPDGSALLLGGSSPVVERFDPRSTGDFASVSLAAPPIGRSGAVLAALPDGRAFVVGGLDEAGAPVGAVELIDPREELGLELDTVPGPALVEHAAATLVDGSAVVAGGRLAPSAGPAAAVTAKAWRLRPGAGDLLESPRELPGGLMVARAGHSMTRLGDEVGADVLVVGGRGAGGEAIAGAELYRPLREAFEPVDGAELGVPRWGHQAMRMPGGFVLVLGGRTDPGGGPPVPVADLELYDPVQGRFAPAGQLPPGAGLTEQTVTRLPDGRLLLAGGRDAGGAEVASAYIARLDPIDGRVDVSATDDLEVPRAGHLAVLLCDGTVLITGGVGAATGTERYNPPSAGRR